MRSKLLPILLAGILTTPASAADGKVRVLIVDGQNNHNWKATTPYIRKALEESGRFTVEVATSPAKGDKEAMARFKPDFGKCDVVLSNYNGDAWPAETQKALEDAVKSGKVGLVVFHAANNSFASWPEFNRMIAMGWRGNKFGDRIHVDADGKVVRVPKGDGPGAGEASSHPFAVDVRDSDHPITRGMPKEWMHTSDQLVHGLRGPAENVHVLATAYSDTKKRGTGTHELMAWTVQYGDGRVFHTPMGHDLTALRCIGLTTLLQRGTEWAATGKVTLPIPKDFPNADKTSSYPAK